MESKPEQLSIKGYGTKVSSPAAKARDKATVAESWDDETASSSDTETRDAPSAPLPESTSNPDPPPPTPASPTGAFTPWNQSRNAVPYRDSSLPASPRDREDDRRRPEKSTAVASRLIAAGLGVRAPQKTDEQKAYDRAATEQEIKRKNREKATMEKKKEEEEEARNAFWRT